ncbi:G protein-coupled glucose receptor regulating Gpa2-domain-containing protein [Armillaria mellea]|nr:G protein-coupled glucose receptor regulating Gpa2-domain-containing protein [Armillaria mellea]
MSSFPMKKHYRHTLIINLAIADFINGVNNGISGAVVLAKGPLTQSPACTANGFIGQLSVQATDTSILAIAVVTVLIVTATHESWLGDSKRDKMRFVTIICACTWVMPLITSFIALGKGYYTAVSGNWCWLTAEPVYLRYVLTHGWRFLFIFIEIGSILLSLHTPEEAIQRRCCEFSPYHALVTNESPPAIAQSS